MKNYIVVAALVLCLASICCAQDSPQSAKEIAFNKVKVASELMGKANGLVSHESTKENLIVAAQLYVQAGQLFEAAGNTLKALGTQNVPQEDVDNCVKATASCLDAVQNIKHILGVKDIPTADNRDNTLAVP